VALQNFAAPKTFTTRNGTVVNAGDNIDYVGWRSEALGNRDTEVLTNSVAVNAGVKRYIGDTWEADLTVGTERIKREENSVNGYANVEPLLNLINSGACDIFTPGADLSGCNGPGVMAQPFQITESRIDTIELRTNGELFDLPAGPVGAAIGGQMMYETFDVQADAASVAGLVTGGGAQSPGSGSRRVTALFGELAIPITEKMETQISGRYDRYNDFGDTFNPQVNFRYKPVSSLLLRASAGTGFKAPNMQDLYAAQSEGFPTFIDQKACAEGVPGACRPRQYRTFSSGNRQLTEENSTSWNLGVVAEPSKRFSASADYFSIKLENTVGTDLEAITLAESQGVDISQYGVAVNRNGSGRIDNVVAPTLNLATTEVQGIDLNLRYTSVPASWGDIIISNNTSLMTKYDIVKFPGLAPESVVDVDPGSPKWRNNLGLDYGFNEKMRLATAFRTIGSNYKSNPAAGKIGAFTQIDLRFTYNIASLKGQVSAGIVNLLNDFPELDESSQSSQLNSSLYDPIGRRLFVGYRQTF